MDEFRVQNLFGVKGKVVLVTGGSRGIGLMIAQGYVANGCRVYIASRKAKVCDKVAQQLTAAGPGTCISVSADLSRIDEVKRLVSTIQQKEKALHVLVNNAGANWAENIATYSDEAFEKVIQLNLKSIFSLTRECLPLLQAAASRADPARIINVGSINGLFVTTAENHFTANPLGIQPPAFQTFAYSSSKAALHMLTRHLAVQLGQDNITVNAIAPGSFESKMMAETLAKFGDAIIAGVPLNRIGKPTDMAGVCLWLSGAAGSYVNGSVIVVDGGAVISTGMSKL